MFNKENQNIHTLIDLIKYIRVLFPNLGLVVAKEVVEAWASANCYRSSLDTLTPDLIMNLSKVAGRVSKGEWVVENSQLYVKRQVKDYEIYES